MRKDKRKLRRRPVRYSAWMALEDDTLHGCVLSDISDAGARLDVEDSTTLPDRFRLLLSGRGSTRHECRVIWRGPGHLGVAFEKRLTEAEALSAPAPNSQTAFAADPEPEPA